MHKILFMIFSLAGGVLIGLQGPINGALGKRIGPLEASLINFTIGILALALITAFLGTGNIIKVLEIPKWMLIGGFLGAFFVTVNAISVPKIGVASVIFAAISGQIAVSLIIDHFGFFGMPQIKFDYFRVIGLLLMISGLLFIFKGNFTR